ncbi:MAG: DUF5680 domain-containing protein [Paracoccaceae bacterium]
MPALRLPTGFRAFLIDGKRRTYAGTDDEATVTNPLLEGSMQLDWRAGDWLYRDIYYGMAAFSGLETVYHAGKPIWAMAYSGGTTADLRTTKAIYAFLRTALCLLPAEFSVRGPGRHRGNGLDYEMDFSGDLTGFHGKERIRVDGKDQYALTFAGGLVR